MKKYRHSFRRDSVGNHVAFECVDGGDIWQSVVIAGHSSDPSGAEARRRAGRRKSINGDIIGALTDHKAAVMMAESYFGRDHAFTALHLSQVGIHEKLLGRDGDALQTHSEVLRIREKVLSAVDPEIAFSCNNVATALEGLGRFDEAQRYYERAISIETAVFGIDGDQTLATRANQVGTLYRAGRFLEAVRLVTRVVDDVANRDARGGMTNRPLAATCLAMLVGVYTAAGRRAFKGRHEALLRKYLKPSA